VKPGVKGLTYPTTGANDEIVGSEDEFDEPVISALGKRDRFGGPGRTAEAKRDSSPEEVERPQKNRVRRGHLVTHSNKPVF